MPRRYFHLHLFSGETLSHHSLLVSESNYRIRRIQLAQKKAI